MASAGAGGWGLAPTWGRWACLTHAALEVRRALEARVAGALEGPDDIDTVAVRTQAVTQGTLINIWGEHVAGERGAPSATHVSLRHSDARAHQRSQYRPVQAHAGTNTPSQFTWAPTQAHPHTHSRRHNRCWYTHTHNHVNTHTMCIHMDSQTHVSPHLAFV